MLVLAEITDLPRTEARPETSLALIAGTTLGHHEDDVTDHLCDVCAQRPAPDTTICRTCTDHLVQEVASVGAYHGLAYDLDIATAKLAKFRASSGGRNYTDEKPILIDERASDAAGALKAALARWARVILDETGAEQPSDTLSAIASWLRLRIRWLAGHADAVQAYDQICDAVRAARFAIDRPAERQYTGKCDCGRPLYAREGDRWVVCRAEEHEEPYMWPVTEMREWMLDQAIDFVGTTTEISAALSRMARPITPAAIRGYVFRDKLRPVWADSRGRALYRLGDVLSASMPIMTSEKIAS